METKRLSGELFAGMVLGGAANLKANADIVNDLNVFPIPDGDTGDNMSRTISGGADRINGTSDSPIGEVAEKIAQGMLLSARGNSGVILSQFFEGLAIGLRGKTGVNASEFAHAFESGVAKAYSSVVKPTEGPILSVMREATEAAGKHVDGNTSFESFFEIFTEEMYRSLDRTPELLPVLKEAGVIDSGGAGFVYIIEGMSRALRGEVAVVNDMAAGTPSGQTPPETDSFDESSPMEFGYCTEVLLQLRADKPDAMGLESERVTEFLSSVGDSVVAFRTGSRIKLHVHTFEPDRVLAWCRKYGEFVSVKIENMSIQHNESNIVNRFVRQTPAKAKERVPIGVVAVAQGDGIKEIFTELGVDCIVDGQQTMNPSAQDFVTAFEKVNADRIIVFPNNSNIILAARQAGELYADSEVFVLPSKSVAQCYAALTMMDLESGDMDTILEDLQMAMDGVITGTVTWAVRDSVANGISVSKGDWLGFADKELKCVARSKGEAAAALLDEIDMTGREIVIAICGEDVKEEDKAILREHVRANFTRTELYEVDGGQDIYSFILAVE